MAMILGIALIVLGILILAAPIVAGVVSVMVVGSVMIIAGIVECVRAIKAQSAISRVTWILVGLITLICGALVIAHPLLGLGFLTLLLAVYFCADGIVKLGVAFRHPAARGWFITSGILSLILAYIIWSNWPVSGGWVIGVLIGINLVFTGILTIAVGEAAK